MFFRQIYDDGLAQASYMIGSEATGLAFVVDPRRDIDVYTELADSEKLRIVAVAETHIHADYLSGGRELAAATGAALYVSGHGDATLGYVPQTDVQLSFVRDSDEIHIGNVLARVRHTPGHTPEHICFEIYDEGKPQPIMLLSGDFLFVGDVGRPDLLEEALGAAGSARDSAHVMFSTLQRLLAELPDFIQIWPGHGAGSACGKALGAIPTTTLGYERRFSWWSNYLATNDEDAFVNALLEGQPDAPTYFARMKHLNRGFTPLLGHLPQPSALPPAALKENVAAGAVIIDTRSRDEFSELHIKGSLCIPDRPSFTTRCAWFVSGEQPIVLLAKPARIGELTRKLVRVGLENIAGFITDVDTAGLPTAALLHVSLGDAQGRLASSEAILLDVRQRGEFAEAHVPNAVHVSAGSLVANLNSLPKGQPLLVMCAGGDRSVAAASVLAAHGFKNVANVPAGFDEWRAQGLPVELDLAVNA